MKPSSAKTLVSSVPRTRTRHIQRCVSSRPNQVPHHGTSTGGSFSTLSTPSVTPVPNRSVLRVEGKDAQKFLKGLTSRDVDEAVDRGAGGGYSGFLAGNGRVLHDVFIYPYLADSTPSTSTSLSDSSPRLSYLIDYPSAPASESSIASSGTHAATTSALSYSSSEESSTSYVPLVPHLKKFILRSKVRVKDVSDEYAVWQSFGPLPIQTDTLPSVTRTWKFGSGGAAEPAWDLDALRSWNTAVTSAFSAPSGSGKTEVGCWDLRAGWGDEGMGRRWLVRNGDFPSCSSQLDVGPSDLYTLRRMLLGVPEGSQEIPPASALPLESCMDVMTGVAFRKGCYSGQELTSRTYFTGNTRKRIMPIRFLPPTSTESSSDPDLGQIIPPALPLRWDALPSSNRFLPGAPIDYIPPASSASKRPKPAVRLLSAHPEYAVGLALIRLEYVERIWGLPGYGSSRPELLNSNRRDLENERGRLRIRPSAGVAGGDTLSNSSGEDPGWSIWAGRGRGWYSPEEESEAGKPSTI